jgi:hypothetical protein
MTKIVRIKRSILDKRDESKKFKEFYFDGVSYTISHLQEKSLPNAVAEAWVAADTDLEIIYPDKR